MSGIEAIHALLKSKRESTLSKTKKKKAILVTVPRDNRVACKFTRLFYIDLGTNSVYSSS